MSTLNKEKVSFISHIVPYSQIEEFGHKILEIQVENHYVNKGMKDIHHTEVFLLKPKEVEQLAKKGLVAVITKKENGIFTQEVAGYAVAVPSSFNPTNQIMKQIMEKIKIEEGENEFFIINAFACQTKGREFVKMIKKLEKNLGQKRAYAPIHSLNNHLDSLVDLFKLKFEYGPHQTVQTSAGIIYLPRT